MRRRCRCKKALWGSFIPIFSPKTILQSPNSIIAIIQQSLQRSLIFLKQSKALFLLLTSFILLNHNKNNDYRSASNHYTSNASSKKELSDLPTKNLQTSSQSPSIMKSYAISSASALFPSWEWIGLYMSISKTVRILANGGRWWIVIPLRIIVCSLRNKRSSGVKSILFL